MSLADPSARRLLPVRLTDIDPDVRVRAARRAIVGDGDSYALLDAALRPSDCVYYVHSSAAALLRKIAA